MPRFQLLVREPGKEPRTVLLGDPIVVGRSRNVDLTVDDEEVGRKQFRVSITSGFVVLEGLGSTNPTKVDDGIIKAGEKTTLPTGARIRVGKTEFELESADATDRVQATPSNPVERTMVAPPPGPAAGPAPAPASPAPAAPSPAAPSPAAPSPADPPPAADAVPQNTMEFRPPGLAGSPGNPAARNPSPEDTSNGIRPGSGAGTGSGEDFGQTMAKGFRPGGPVPSAPPSTPKPQTGPQAKAPAPEVDHGNTMAGGPPFGGAPAAPQPPKPQPPKPQPPKPQPPKPQPPKPQPQPQPPKAPVATPQQPAAPTAEPTPTPPKPEKPKTVAVRPEEMAAQPATSTEMRDDLESRLHQSTPRLFVKGEGLKRPVRLLKASNKIGRAETADVLLPHESVSEQHAEIRFDGEQWTLVDLGSTNGSVVDGVHLRGNAQAMRRNALIGIGALHLIFLYVDEATAAQDRRDEDRALQLLTKSGRIDKSTANDIRQMVRSEASQSIAEIVLRDTPMAPTDWASAVATARQKVSLLGRILRIFSFGKR